MNIQEAAKLAIDVQDACNLSGVTFSFAKVMQAICDDGRASPHKGTDWRNNHPVAKLFIWKMALLNGIEVNGDFGEPYDMCKRLANGEVDVY